MRTPGGPRQLLHKVISVALAHNRMIHLECRFRASSLLDGHDAPDQSESRLTWRKEEPVALMLAALDIVSIFYAAARLRLSLLWGNQRISFDKACSRIYKRKMRWCVGFLFDMLLTTPHKHIVARKLIAMHAPIQARYPVTVCTNIRLLGNRTTSVGTTISPLCPTT